jgi:hypothetical protein
MLVAGCPPWSGSRAPPRRDEFALAIVPRKRVGQARYHRREPDDERNQGDQHYGNFIVTANIDGTMISAANLIRWCSPSISPPRAI